MKTRMFASLAGAALAVACLLPSGASALMPPARAWAWGFIDRSGQIVVPPACDNASLGEKGDWVSVERDGKQGFLNLKTKETTGLVFDTGPLMLFAQPLFALGPEPVVKDGKYGYVDASGQTIIPFHFELAREFAADGLAAVKVHGQFGYINRHGDFVLPPRFEAASDFGPTGLAKVKVAGLWGIINRRGIIVILAKFQELTLQEAGDLAIVSQDGRMGAVDMRGNVVIPLKFTHLRNFGGNGLAAASLDANRSQLGREGGHWGFIDRHGEFVVPPIYTEVTDFEDEQYRKTFSYAAMRAPLGLAQVESVNADGVESTTYIDSRGHAVIRLPAGIIGVHDLGKGLFTVFDERKPGNNSLSGRSGIFDSTKPNSPIVWFDGVDRGSDDGDLLVVIQHGLWGYANRSGTVVIEPQFRRASRFTADGLALVQAKNPVTGAYSAAFIDRTGTVKLLTPFEDISTFGESGFARVITTRPMGMPIGLPASQCARDLRLPSTASPSS